VQRPCGAFSQLNHHRQNRPVGLVALSAWQDHRSPSFGPFCSDVAGEDVPPAR
jgi:hypothetical protein